MYWPTSFCERENSSKRWRISSESVSAVVPDRVTGEFFAGSAGFLPASAAPAPPRGPDRILGEPVGEVHGDDRQQDHR